jgi:pimeloyl-ACP methyl ester carboxylesterase
MMKEVNLSNGETIAYREQGKGAIPFVMLHGNMTSSRHMDILFERMPKDLRVIAPDMRGFGQSTYIQPINSLEDFADDMIEFVDRLGFDHFYLGGWSTGGGVAMVMAAKQPERVLGLVLVESVGIAGYPMFRKDQAGQPIAGDLLNTKEEIAADLVQVIPVLDAYATHNKDVMRAIWNAVIYTNKQPDPDRYETYLEDMMSQRNLVDVDYALVHFNISHENNGLEEGDGQVDLLHAPVLVFQGDRDLVVPPAMGQGIRDALGDKAEYVTGDWGHSPFIDVPDLLCGKIEAFLKARI